MTTMLDGPPRSIDHPCWIYSLLYTLAVACPCLFLSDETE